jgi:dynein heavy chain, axonemal
MILIYLTGFYFAEYVTFIDNIIYTSLLHTIGISIGYMAENMDPVNKFSPLFESRLELLEPNLVFFPSLDPKNPDGFNQSKYTLWKLF